MCEMSNVMRLMEHGRSDQENTHLDKRTGSGYYVLNTPNTFLLIGTKGSFLGERMLSTMGVEEDKASA